MNPDFEVTGTVDRVEDHGSIVLIYLGAVPIYCDHRCVQHMLDAEGDFRGREATFHPESGGLEFH